MNIRELAEQLGVSPGTVSKCLSSSPCKDKIPAETVQRVRDYASSVGYVPNHFAQQVFRRGESGIIGVLIRQDTAIQRNIPILNEILVRLEGLHREYLVLSNLPEKLQDSLRTFKSMKIHDIIVIGSTNNCRLTDERLLSNLRLYALDYMFGYDGNDCNYYHFRGGIDRQQLYLHLGHLLQDQGFFPFACDIYCAPTALKADQLMTDDLVLDIPLDQSDSFQYGAQMADWVMDRHPRAVILHNDQHAVGLCNELLRRGVSIPEDLAVIGFNNSFYLDEVPIPLTSVALPTMQTLNSVLDHLLEHGELPSVMKHIPEIICRQSTPERLNRALRNFRSLYQ